MDRSEEHLKANTERGSPSTVPQSPTHSSRHQAKAKRRTATALDRETQATLEGSGSPAAFPLSIAVTSDRFLAPSMMLQTHGPGGDASVPRAKGVICAAKEGGPVAAHLLQAIERHGSLQTRRSLWPAQWHITRRRTRGVPPSPPTDSGQPECRPEAASGDMHGTLRVQAHPMQPDEPDMVLKLHQAICMAHCVCRPIPCNPMNPIWSDGPIVCVVSKRVSAVPATEAAAP